MYTLLSILVISISLNCCAGFTFDKSIDNLLQLDKSRKVQCKCGKTYYALKNIPHNEIKSISNLESQIGSPDTSFSEVIMQPCSSLVYVCDSNFVSFHFRESKNFVGRSYGEIIDGEYVKSGSSVELRKK